MAKRMNLTIPGPGPWGFRLAGGKDFNTPLYISKITPGGKAARASILENDTILAINGKDVKTMTHLEAQNLIKGAVGNLSFSLERSSQAITWTPEVSHQEGQGYDVSLKANKQQFQHAGSSHNIKAKPFPGSGGGAPSATIVHKQFNSPVGIYSPQNIAESFKGQTEGLSPNAGMDDAPPPPPAWQQPSSYVGSQSSYDSQKHFTNPGAQSRTFKMIQQLSTEDDPDFPPPPPEVNRPSGMRSVKAPITKPLTGGAKPASALPVCHKCDRDITGPFVKVRGNPLHDTCFSCEACGLQLRNKGDDTSSEEGFFVIEDKLYCEDDKNRYYQQRTPGQMNGSAAKVPPPPPNEEPVMLNGDSSEVMAPPPEPIAYVAAPESTTFTATQEAVIFPPPPEAAEMPMPEPPPFTTVHAPVISHRDGDDTASPSTYTENQAPAPDTTVLKLAPEPWAPHKAMAAPALKHISAPLSKSSGSTHTAYSAPSSISKPPSHVAQAGRTKAFSPGYSQPSVGQPISPPPPPPPGPGPAQSQYSWKPQAPAAPRANPPMAARPTPPRANLPPAVRQPGMPAARQPGMTAARLPGVAPGSQRSSGGGPLAPGTRTAYCDSCNDPIRGTFVTAFGRNWHPEHFVCAHCHKNLQGQGLIEEKGKIYCEQDYLQLYAPKCTSCRKAITGECVKAMGAEYHPACFVCGVCKQPITGEGFHIIDGQMFCKRDYQAKFKSAKCSGCNYPIESGEAWLEALEKSYHAECFTCTQCSQRLEGQRFYAKAGRPYCQVHGS